MKVLELYSGIGGMHLALKESEVQGVVVASVDINTVANTVYKHNFPSTKLLNRNVQSLPIKFINNLDIDTILMSPPCQPFTRNGKKRDVEDHRTCSFTYLLHILPELEVKNILIENVKGFESSEMRKNLVQALTTSNFTFQEFVLSPTQCGVPNTRHRYYCLAKKSPLQFSFATGPLKLPDEYCSKIPALYTISSILEDNVKQEYTLSDKVLSKHARVLDICYSDSARSCCFTKAYGRYVEGTGSVYCDKSEEELDHAYSIVEEDEYLAHLTALNLRFFTPREVCRLMAFPESFHFPETITTKQKYMLLGNSINIKVVSELIKVLND